MCSCDLRRCCRIRGRRDGRFAYERHDQADRGATATAALVAEPLDLAFAALTLWLRRASLSTSADLRSDVRGVSLPLHADRGGARDRVHRVSPWTLPLFFIPALAAQRLFGLYQEQRQLAAQLVDANADLEKANLSFATALVTTLDARDRYTAGHSAAVAIYARDIAVRMGLPEEEAQKGAPRWARPRHRQDRALGGAAREAGRAHARGAPRDAATLGDRRAHSREGRRAMQRSPRSCAITTSESTAAVIRTGSQTRRSRSSHGSSPSLTPTTR